MTALREAPDHLVVETAIERLGHLTMRRGESLLSKGVPCCLEIADVQHVGIGTDLVERAAQEQLVTRHARQVERCVRHQEDLVAGAGEVELLFGALLEIGDDRLSGGTEVDNRVAHLLHLPPQGRGSGRPDDDAGHTRVDLGFPQGVHHRADGRRRLEDLADDPAGFGLLEITRDLHQQD